MVLRIGRDVLFAQVANQRDGLPHLGDVDLAAGADAEMALKAGALIVRQRVIEVCGHQLYQLFTGQLSHRRSPCALGLVFSEIGFERLADARARPVEQDPLIRFADTEDLADVLRGISVYIAQANHALLVGG